MASQCMHSPKEAHLEAIYRTLRYLKGSIGRGLFFKKNENKDVEVSIEAKAKLMEDRTTIG